MKRAYSIVLTLIQSAISILTYCQSTEIDSLQRILPSLKDTARVDCLCSLSVQYLLKADKDSFFYYANNAYKEAQRLNYMNGLARYFSIRAYAQRCFYDDFPSMKAFAQESLKWYGRTTNKTRIETPYYAIGLATMAESLYDESIWNLQQSYYWAKKNGDKEWMLDARELIQEVYRESGDYDKSFDAFQQVQQLNQNLYGKRDSIYDFIALGSLHSLLEDYSTALSYFKEFVKKVDKGEAKINMWGKTGYAELLAQNQQFESAMNRYNQMDSAKLDNKDLRIFLVSKGEYYLLLNQYGVALPYFLKGLIAHRQLNDRNQIKRTLLDIAKTYTALHNDSAALRYTREALALSIQTKSKQYIRDAYQLLFNIYDRYHQTDSAFFYFRKYTTQKDVVANDVLKGKFAAYNYEQKIALLNKEGEIQNAKLEKASFIKDGLITGILVLLVMGTFMFRVMLLKRKNEKLQLQHALEVQKIENEKTKNELQHQAAELEMQALRAQMNPHFIFNCLNAINHFILNNEPDIASGYLTKFSRLIRAVLYLSQRSEISLQEELDCLNLYIQLEQLRFQKHFQYTIHYNDAIDTESIKTPPMLMQPFVENAIWHGLMHKPGAGELHIGLTLDEHLLCCTITDNGIGRSEAAALKSKSAAHKKSMGIQITADRLQLLNEGKNEGFFVQVSDLTGTNGNSTGTKVVLTIPVTVFQNPMSNTTV